MWSSSICVILWLSPGSMVAAELTLRTTIACGKGVAKLTAPRDRKSSHRVAIVQANALSGTAGAVVAGSHETVDVNLM